MKMQSGRRTITQHVHKNTHQIYCYLHDDRAAQRLLDKLTSHANKSYSLSLVPPHTKIYNMGVFIKDVFLLQKKDAVILTT